MIIYSINIPNFKYSSVYLELSKSLSPTNSYIYTPSYFYTNDTLYSVQ